MVFPAPLGPTSATRSPGLESQVETAEDRRRVGLVTRGHRLERQRRVGRRVERRRRILDRRLPIGELEHASPGGEGAGELARRRGESRDGFERRDRQQGQQRNEHPIERTRRARLDGDGENRDERQPGDEDGETVAEPAHDRVAPREAIQLAIGFCDPLEHALLGAVDSELRRSAQELDELGRQRASRRGLAGSCGAAEPAGDEWNRDSSEDQPDCQHQTGDRQKGCRGPDADRSGRERDKRWAKPAEIEPLQGVDVSDHPGHEVAAAEGLQAGRGERLDARVEPRANVSERAQREIVRPQPVRVAGERTREPEEADADDRRGQREDCRAFGGA